MICQSCGMQIMDDSEKGTNADGTFPNEYCCYCFVDGKLGKDEMVDSIAPFRVEAGIYDNIEEARQKIKGELKNLKGWR